MNRAADDFTSLRDLFPADQVILDPVELITYEIDAGVDRETPGRRVPGRYAGRGPCGGVVP